MTDVCLQGKQVYAEKQLERLKAAERMSKSKQLDGAISNGKIANGHTNGHTNGYTNETAKKTQWGGSSRGYFHRETRSMTHATHDEGGIVTDVSRIVRRGRQE